jgi:hypothetical protein
VIRAVVQPGPDPGSGSSQPAALSSPFDQQAVAHPAAQEAMVDSLVATCVRTVLRRLERSRDR